MKHKITIAACLWLLLVFSQQVLGSIGEHHLSKWKTGTERFFAPPPAPGFTYTADGGCAPVTVQFYSQMNGPAYSWTFGDGGTSTDCNPVHTFVLPGTYTVTLVATGGTYTTTITVGAVPVVTFTGDSVSCQGDIKNYSITSTIPPASYSWSAQGGTVSTSTATTATVTWSTYGVNYLNYTITTAAGCTKVFRYKVKVIPPPQVNLPCCDKRQEDGTAGKSTNPPGQEGTPGGSEPCSACAGSYNCYKGTINPEFGTVADYTWVWTVTNGTIVSISADSSEACVIWGASGTGTIKLEMTNKQYGCKTIKLCEVTIKPGVTPSFTVSGNCINSPVYFDATATTPLASVATFTWEFGDGYTETTTTPFATHEFAFVGTYTATLTIKTTEGCIYKNTYTFNVITGTKPEIECPGTVCEGSRQCYSTTLISGATYTWTITGDVPAARVITNNKVCVTWGSGPVGTVTVTVTGGGYTCTNSATEAIAIVSSVIPINAPTYICASSTYLQVSTANYAGACYKWSVNGTAQPSTSYQMAFNPSSYTNPITIKVDVDFPIGCCHGSGIKVITKLPEYTMGFYQNTTCIGSSVTYSLIFPAGAPVPPVSWSVDGGIITSSTSSSVTITWNTLGVGSITAGNNSPTQYCNDATNNTWNVTVMPRATGDDISGPSTVCAGVANTYYHAWQNPTGGAVVSVSPAGASIAASAYSSSITFPAVAVPTIYTISVTYTHATLTMCDTTKTYQVKVMPTTIPTFSGVGGTICQGDIVTYTATVPDMLNYSWQVIGGSIVSQTYIGTTLTIQVQWNSTVTSSLTMFNKVCGTSNSQPITVNGKPVVIISSTAPTCGGGGVTLSVANVWASYSWSPTGSTTNTTLASSIGTYSVTVSNGVCSNTGSTFVSVVSPTPPTITGFTVTPPTSNVCPKYNQICPIISPGSGSIVSYSWTFSGFTITSSSAVCPAVALSTMPGPATGTWSLTITDSYGCTATQTGSLTDACTTGPGGPGGTCTPVSTFSISYNPCTGQFTESGTNYISVVYYFGDGVLASGSNPVHLYTTACNKTVSCYVTDINNCTSVYTFTISVPYVFSMPALSVTNSTCLGASSITANGISICAGSGYSASYAWTVTPVGGGVPYTATTSSNTLNVGSIIAIPNGAYNVSVTMTVSNGTSTCSRTITGSFNKGGLKAYFVSCGGCAGSPLSFLDQSIAYLAPLIKWEWTFTGPGPTTINSFLQNPTILFSISGSWNVKLKVTDNNGCTNTFNATIIIQPPFAPGNIKVNSVPTASGTQFDICPGASYTLTAPTGTSYSWSTGSTSSSITVTDQGDYYVTVFNANNCSAKVGPIKFRYKPAPEAIILSGVDACSPRLLRAFTGTGYTYLWNYPVSLTSSMSYIYMNTGGAVSLTVTNLYGCSDSKTQNYIVNPSPSNYITYAPQPFCPGSTVTLTSNPSGGTPPYTYLWNNGGTLVSIAGITSPGLYKNTVKDANGCKATALLNLQPVIPSGMDQLPHGCYDICGQQTKFCAGTMPFGWTGQWLLNGSPYGSSIPQGGNIAIPFTMSGTYTLQYTPVNPAVACPAVSDPIIINFYSLPAITIIPGISPAVICIGSGGSILLTASLQSPDYNYTWYFGAVVVGTGYTYTATAAGTYTLEVSKGGCCKTTATIIIDEVNCCFENPNVPFTPILTPLTISSNTFWFDKYYIDAVVTVTGSAILDITNVDCVFGPNGTIVFQNQSFLRCNNSVLRPCEKDDIWQGLHFQDQSSGWINTTTIKNAIIGVEINGNNMGVRLTDNSFVKCHEAVHISKSQSQQSISGNTFEIDETQLPYTSNPNEYWAIKLYDVEMKGLIAQNTFRHVQPQQTSNNYYGIYAEYSNMTVSENEFDDMFRSIDVTQNRNVIGIEKNVIKLNYLKETYDSYQIRATDCNLPVLMYENQMDNGLGDQSSAGAIYCEHNYRTHIKDNKINGFRQGIFGIFTDNLHIASNTITSNSNIGITIWWTGKTILSCNTINGMNTNSNTRYGIVEIDGDGSASIYANCIFNMNTAMYLQGLSPGYNLPAVFNNYMYNYNNTGIFVDNYSGSIGTPGGPTNAGRNTFMSNNGSPGTTLDINSIFPITEDGNFGVQLTSNAFSSTPPDQFYSTASCGQQIQNTYPKNQLDQYNVCDIYFLDRWVYKTTDGKYELMTPTSIIDISTINQKMKTGETEILGEVTAKMLQGGSSAKNAADALLSSTMDRNLAARLLVSNFLSIQDVQSASSYLSSPQLSAIDADLKVVLETRIALAHNSELTSGQHSALTAIDDKNNTYSPMARDLIQGKEGEHDYKFHRADAPKMENNTTNLISKQTNYLSVYPVPAAKMVSVKHNVKDANVQSIKIVSAAGVEVANFHYTIQSGIINIDISSLASGIYSVILVTDKESASLMTGRFIKAE